MVIWYYDAYVGIKTKMGKVAFDGLMKRFGLGNSFKMIDKGRDLLK